MAFGKRGREERAEAIREGGSMSGRNAARAAREFAKGRTVNGKVYVKGKVVKDLNKDK